jgi:peptidoglycan DL-endopeptidase CwlO
VEGNNIGAQAVRQAATQLGKPYVFGSGPDTSSFDRSDLVQWSYRQLGISIPGDPIYRRSGGHVVIYAGGGKVIAAPHTGTVVQYQPLSNFPPTPGKAARARDETGAGAPAPTRATPWIRGR